MSGKRSKIQYKILNDPIWGPIKLHPLCIKIIDTPEFQRLRFVKQLGGCSFVYPGACHTRFEHSIGTSHLAGLLVRTLIDEDNMNPDYGINIDDKDILCVEIAGLCHDLGHGAFSHLFESMFIPKIDEDSHSKHENASIRMLDRIIDTDIYGLKESAKKFGLNLETESEDRKFIKGLIDASERNSKRTEDKKDFLYEIVANEENKIDVDKWDYFSRDCHMLGLKHNFQIMRSIMLARVIKHNKEYHISFPTTEYMNIFDMYHARYTLHRRAYQHPVNKAVEIMVGDGKEEIKLSDTINNMEAYTLVTDGVIDRIRFENFEEDEKFKKAKEIIDRIFRRDFYKCEKKSGMERRVQESKEVKERKITKDVDEEGNNKKNQEIIKKLIDDGDIHVEPVFYNYGAQEQNPMDDVYFYRGDTSAKPTYDEKSGMLPSCFQETYLRMYWKKSSEEGKDEAMRAFKSLYGRL